MQKKYLTIDGKIDGFGAQLMAKMTGVAYCERYGFTYIHTPFKSIGHNITPQTVETLEDFTGMRSGDALFGDINVDNLNIESHKIIRDVVLSNAPDLYYTPHVRKLLRIKYYSSTKLKPAFFDENKINVCLHVRRGDVGVSLKNRYTENNDYIEVIKKLQSYESMVFHVFSNGCKDEFDEFNQFDNVILHINRDLTETFHAMVVADILVPAKSALSYCAAILSTGLVLNDCMTPFFTARNELQCKPLNAWQGVSKAIESGNVLQLDSGKRQTKPLNEYDETLDKGGHK